MRGVVKTIRSAAVIVLLVALLLAGCAQQAVQQPSESEKTPTTETKEPIKIGAAIPLTGPGSLTGLELQRGMKLAEKEINSAGGVLGRPIKIIFEDTKTNPDAAKSAVKRLAEIENVDVLTGIMSSSVFAGVIPDLKRYQKVTLIVGAAYSPFEEKFKDDDWFFHVHPYDYHNVKFYAKFLKDIGVKSIVLFYESGAFGTGSKKQIEETFPDYGIQVLDSLEFTSGSGDFRSLITRAKQLNPDALLWVGYEVDALPIVLQCKELDFNPKIIAGSPPSWSKEFMQSKESEYVIGISYWNEYLPTEESKKFVEKYKEEYGVAPLNYFAVIGYSTIMAVAKGIEKAGSVEKDKLIKGLEQVELNTPMGTLRFAPSKYIKHQGFTDGNGVGFQWRESKQIPVYPPEIAVENVVYPVPKWSER
ncbi:ABC transporter substrate-binding protein [Archaeoglobus neptunius]|uniref:ABC transporter substrate-binding protein n=1 Tax=Archaeoglobus neptunius TaxID=2798580 RepID=UPI001927F58B|nr:ABC transporter substrate-binding protein [Archaeoglobus neptunius]